MKLLTSLKREREIETERTKLWKDSTKSSIEALKESTRVNETSIARRPLALATYPSHSGFGDLVTKGKLCYATA